MKYTKIALTVCSVSAAFFLSACVGGSSSGMSGDATRTFIDAPVENLKYSCDPSGISGVTDRDGKFSCKYSDDVSFHIGKMTIGSMEFVEDMVVTPYKLNPTNSTAAVRLAQLLQSLDDDGDMGSRITVEKKYAEAIEIYWMKRQYGISRTKNMRPESSRQEETFLSLYRINIKNKPVRVL